MSDIDAAASSAHEDIMNRNQVSENTDLDVGIRGTQPFLKKFRSALVGAGAGFVAYFCMCGLRRPFMVLEFPGETLGSSLVELKTSLIISQILGYGLSKYLGISACSQIARARMGSLLVLLIVIAEGALVLLPMVSGKWILLAMFLNGLPLGIIWGLMVRYLEGRELSDMMLAILSCSFILGSGAVKDVGRWWLRLDFFPELWMPAVTGLCFLPPFFIAILFLHRLPVPDRSDIEHRHARIPMSSLDRWSFLKSHLWTLIPLLLFYFLLTAFRDFRDLYSVEIIRDLGYGNLPTILTRIELPVAILVTTVLGLLTIIRDNKIALWAIYGVMLSGMLTIGLGTLLFESNSIDGMTWMIFMGIGAYFAYVPYNAILFERFMASTRATGTAVFGIYLADSLGYTGSIALQILKDALFSGISRLHFFLFFSLLMCGIGTCCLLWSSYFLHRDLNTMDKALLEKSN